MTGGGRTTTLWRALLGATITLFVAASAVAVPIAHGPAPAAPPASCPEADGTPHHEGRGPPGRRGGPVGHAPGSAPPPAGRPGRPGAVPGHGHPVRRLRLEPP